MGSPRKIRSTGSMLEERGSRLGSTRSCESFDSTRSMESAALVYRQGASNVSMSSGRSGSYISATSEVHERLISARRLRLKNFQSQLTEAKRTIEELTHENRCLRTLQKRQDSALSKYQSSNADLPKLLNRHAEELRVWQVKYNNLKQTNKELEQKLKQKESIIQMVSDQNKYYSKLNKDRNLEERQRLSEKVQKLNERLNQKDNEMKQLARRVLLENKTFKQQLEKEQRRTKEVAVKLEKTRIALQGYEKLDDLGDQFTNMAFGKSKRSNIEPTNLKKELQKMLSGTAEPVDSEKGTDDTDILPRSSRSSKSLDAGKLELGSLSYRNMRKLKSESANAGNRNNNKQLGGTDSARSNTSSGVKKQHQQKQLKQLKEQEAQKKPQRKMRGEISVLPAITDVEEDFENDDVVEDDVDLRNKSYRSDYHSSYTLSSRLKENVLEYADNDSYENVEGDEEEMDETPESKSDEWQSQNGEIEDLQNEDDEEQNYIDEETDESEEAMNTAKRASSEMREQVRNMRKEMAEEYKGRAAFLDSFCQQSSTAPFQADTQKARSCVPRSGQKSQKHIPC